MKRSGEDFDENNENSRIRNYNADSRKSANTDDAAEIRYYIEDKSSPSSINPVAVPPPAADRISPMVMRRTSVLGGPRMANFIASGNSDTINHNYPKKLSPKPSRQNITDEAEDISQANYSEIFLNDEDESSGDKIITYATPAPMLKKLSMTMSVRGSGRFGCRGTKTQTQIVNTSMSLAAKKIEYEEEDDVAILDVEPSSHIDITGLYIASVVSSDDHVATNRAGCRQLNSCMEAYQSGLLPDRDSLESISPGMTRTFIRNHLHVDGSERLCVELLRRKVASRVLQTGIYGIDERHPLYFTAVGSRTDRGEIFLSITARLNPRILRNHHDTNTLMNRVYGKYRVVVFSSAGGGPVLTKTFHLIAPGTSSNLGRTVARHVLTASTRILSVPDSLSPQMLILRQQQDMWRQRQLDRQKLLAIQPYQQNPECCSIS